MTVIYDQTSTIVGGSTIQLEVVKNAPSAERGAVVGFSIALTDRDSGAIASASIDIASISVTIEKSTGGGAFSAAGLTAPTFAKADGLVSSSYLFASGEWAAGDTYRLRVSGITCTIGLEGATAYVAVQEWGGLVQDHTDVVEDVNDIRSTLGQMTDAPRDMNSASDGTDTLVQLGRAALERIGETPSDADDSLHTVLGQRDDAASTGAPGTTTTVTSYAKQTINDVQDILDGAWDVKRSPAGGTATAWIDVDRVEDTARTEATGYWIGYGLLMTGGTQAGKVRRITAWNATTKLFTVTGNFPSTGSVGDTYEIIPPLAYALAVLGSTRYGDGAANESYTELAPNTSIAGRTYWTQRTLGGRGDAAASGDSGLDASATVVSQIKHVVNLLIGSAGAAAFPSAQAPANGVNLFEVSREVYDRLVLLQADLGDASGATLGSILGILGNPGTNSLATVLGQLADAAAAGDPGSATAVSYLKQIVNTLEGTAGMSVWPAAAAPADGVSIAEAVRKIYDDLVTLAAGLALGGTITGTADAGSTAGILRDAARTEADDHFNGQLLVMTSGNNAGLSSVIVDFIAATDDIVVDPDFPNAIGAGDTYTILPRSTNADILLGHNNADNAADTSAVVPNRDGSFLERAEEIADDTDQVIAEIGGATEAAVQPGVEGPIHGHIREAQVNIDTVETKLDVVDGFHDVPNADSTANTQVRDVIGNKSDAASSGAMASAIARIKDIKSDVGGLAGAAMRGTDGAALASDYTGPRAANLDNLDATVSSRATQASVDAIPTTAMRGTDNAFLAADGGTKSSARHTGDPDNATDAIGYLKQAIMDIVGDSNGIATWPASMGPGPSVSMARVVSKIYDLVVGAEVAGPFSYLDAGGEQTVYESTLTTMREVAVEFSNRNMTQAGTFKLYRKEDGTNYDLYGSVAVLASGNRAFDATFETNQHWKLTYTEGADEAAARDIPFNVIEQARE